jgi:hypothetical protein
MSNFKPTVSNKTLSFYNHKINVEIGRNLGLVEEFSTGCRTPIKREITAPFQDVLCFFLISTEMNQPLKLRSVSDVHMLTGNRFADCNFGAT